MRIIARQQYTEHILKYLEMLRPMDHEGINHLTLRQFLLTERL